MANKTVVKPSKPEGDNLVQARWIALKGHLVAAGYDAQEVNDHFGAGNPTVVTDVQLADLTRTFFKEHSNA